MISALKKFARKNEEAKPRSSMPTGVSSMGQSLQRKFGRGVQYNMKIVIKGDRNTGKSTLLARFQGKPFKEQYIPTNEIKVCSINWSYRVADDVVKVEVWDVVDKGKRKKSDGDGLKLANNIANEDQVSGVLDAEFVDVYKGTHGCIMILDISKQWTFKYIERELPKVPPNIPVLILANFLDMQEHRVVQREEIESYIKYYDRGEDAAVLHYGECCMKNGFGLKYIHKFFNIPFLKLQRESLEKQLEINKEDMKATLEELSFHKNSEEQDYDKFLAYMEKKAKEKNQPSTPPRQTLGNDMKSSLSSISSKSSSTSIQSSSLNTSNLKASPVSSKKSSEQAKSIDDFVPEDTIDSNFLAETEKGVNKKTTVASDNDTSDDDNDSDKGGNPMVSGFQDISSDDEKSNNFQNTTVPQNETSQPKLNTSFDVDIELTSDESDAAEETTVKVTPVVDSDDDIVVTEKKTEPVKPLVQETKYDITLNDEDNNFMDAWLDSPSTDPREISVKSTKKENKTITNVSKNDLDMFEASQLSTKSSSKTEVAGDDNSSSNDEEKRKKQSTRKQPKDGEEGKQRHRSKHKHKKKSRTKDTEDGETESGEKKHKSKKKSRHKDEKSREKIEGTGAEYESF